MDTTLFESIQLHLYKTITIFTESGGVSGCGFTGVLLNINECIVTLILDFAQAPECPCEGTCTCKNECSSNPCNVDKCCCKTNKILKNNFLGARAIIPINKIVSFSHHTR